MRGRLGGLMRFRGGSGPGPAHPPETVRRKEGGATKGLAAAAAGETSPDSDDAGAGNRTEDSALVNLAEARYSAPPNLQEDSVRRRTQKTSPRPDSHWGATRPGRRQRRES